MVSAEQGEVQTKIVVGVILTGIWFTKDFDLQNPLMVEAVGRDWIVVRSSETGRAYSVCDVDAEYFTELEKFISNAESDKREFMIARRRELFGECKLED